MTLIFGNYIGELGPFIKGSMRLNNVIKNQFDRKALPVNGLLMIMKVVKHCFDVFL